MMTKAKPAQPDCNRTGALKRRLTLPLLTLYGLGVTVGAGIYVLVGITAAKAGFFAPVSFLLAAMVVAFTGFSYSELGTRYPVSAGEAAYVRNGLKSSVLALVVGLMVATSGVVSSAVISIGAAAYIGQLVPLSHTTLMVLVIVSLGLVAAWGILESVVVAAVFTVIEIAGLLFVIWYGFTIKPDLLSEIGRLVPPLEPGAWTGIASAGLLAFFAFVGFEDIANVAEEVKNPQVNLPLAVILTLLIATILYMAGRFSRQPGRAYEFAQHFRSPPGSRFRKRRGSHSGSLHNRGIYRNHQWRAHPDDHGITRALRAGFAGQPAQATDLCSPRNRNSPGNHSAGCRHYTGPCPFLSHC